MKTKLTVLSFALLAGWGAHAQTADTSHPATPEQVQAIADNLKSALDTAKVSDVRVAANGKVACGFVNARIFAMSLNKDGKPAFALGIGADRRDAAVRAECQKVGINLPQ